MGQQETTMTVATEEKGGGTLLRRIILVLTVAALMAVMLAVMAMPAMAKQCCHPVQGPAPPEYTGNNLLSNSGSTVFHGFGGACVNHDNGHGDTGGAC
jgi:hypothetical protein